jgi:hypothetical protein
MLDFALYPVEVTAGMTGSFSADPVSVWRNGGGTAAHPPTGETGREFSGASVTSQHV